MTALKQFWQQITNKIGLRSRPTLAGLWLIAAMPVTIVIVGLLNELFDWEAAGIGDDWFLAVLTPIHFGAGYLWARSLSRRLGLPARRAMNAGAAIGFALMLVGPILNFDILEGISTWLLNLMEKRRVTHFEFATIFTVWTGLVCGGSALGLALGGRDGRLALKLLAAGLVTGCGTFLSVVLLMDRLGFRVGTPRPDGVPSMPIVTLLGIWAAALAGSFVLGRLLAAHVSRQPGEEPIADIVPAEGTA